MEEKNPFVLDALPRRVMPLIFVVDTSGSMDGAKIASVNTAVQDTLNDVGEISRNNADAQIKVAALEFSSGVQWMYPQPIESETFQWQDLEACGVTSLGAAYAELNEKLSRSHGFMAEPTGSRAPAIILLTDGMPTDEWKHPLAKLKNNPWFKAGVKVAIAIGDESTNVDVLEDQTDLLYTEPLADMDKTDCGGVVTVPFRHALCSMNFRVKNRVADNEKIIIKKIILDAARHCGDFRSMPDPRWTLDARTARFVFFEGDYQTGHQPSEIGDNILMIPQALETPVTVVYEFVTHAGTSITQELKTTLLQKELLPGKNYTFTITVGIDDVKFLVEIIEGFLNI